MSVIIDCDAQPFIPEGWKLANHQKGGIMEFDPASIGLFVADAQKTKRGIRAHKLFGLLKAENRPVLNACVLDYFLAHKEIVPKTWIGKCVLFFGTTLLVPKYVPPVDPNDEDNLFLNVDRGSAEYYALLKDNICVPYLFSSGEQNGHPMFCYWNSLPLNDLLKDNCHIAIGG